MAGGPTAQKKGPAAAKPKKVLKFPAAPDDPLGPTAQKKGPAAAKPTPAAPEKRPAKRRKLDTEVAEYEAPGKRLKLEKEEMRRRKRGDGLSEDFLSPDWVWPDQLPHHLRGIQRNDRLVVLESFTTECGFRCKKGDKIIVELAMGGVFQIFTAVVRPDTTDVCLPDSAVVRPSFYRYLERDDASIGATSFSSGSHHQI